MAWVTVTNSDGVWEYENTANANNTYADAPGTYSGGIRTFTFPNGHQQNTYVRVRKAGETIERGELSKDYFDAQGSVGGATDPDFASVVLLTNFDGVDGSNTATDASGSAHAWTFVNQAQIDTTFKKFGTASLLTDGDNDGAYVPWSTDFQFGTGDFTIEFWARLGSVEPATGFAPCGIWNTGFNDRVWQVDYDVINNRMRFQYSTTGGNTLNNVWFDCDTDGVDVATLFNDDFHHFAVIKQGSNTHIHVDGFAGGGIDTTNPTYRASSASTPLMFGGVGTAATIVTDFAGSIDEVRITKGVARYTPGVDFTPPTEAFPTS